MGLQSLKTNKQKKTHPQKNQKRPVNCTSLLSAPILFSFKCVVLSKLLPVAWAFFPYTFKLCPHKNWILVHFSLNMEQRMPSYLDTFGKLNSFFKRLPILHDLLLSARIEAPSDSSVAHASPYSHLTFYPELHSAQNSWNVFLFSLCFIFIQIINNNLQGNLNCGNWKLGMETW